MAGETNVYDPKYTISSYSMAASGTGYFVFNNNVTAGKCSKMNYNVYGAIISAEIQPNAPEPIGKCFTVQLVSDPMHTLKAVEDF